MIAFFLIVLFVLLNLSFEYNEDYVAYLVLFFMPLVVTTMAIKLKFGRRFYLHPVIIFNFTYFLLFVPTDILDIYYEPRITELIIMGYYAFNAGVLVLLPLFKNKLGYWVLPLECRSYNLYIFLSFLFAIASGFVYFYHHGVPLLAYNIDLARTLQNEGGISPVYQLMNYNASIAFLVFCVNLVKKFVRKINIKIFYINYLMAFLYVIILLMLANRTSLLFLFVPVGTYYVISVDKLQWRHVIIAVTLVGMLASFGAYRSGKIDVTIFDSMLSELIAIKSNLNRIYYHYVDTEELEYGAMQLKGVAVLLPGRQIDGSLYLKEKLGVEFTGGGLTPSIVGQLFIDFREYGLAIEMFILGMLMNTYFIYVLRSNKEFQWLFFCWMMAYWPNVIRGGVLYSYSIVFAFLFLFAYRYYYRFFKPNSRRSKVPPLYS